MVGADRVLAGAPISDVGTVFVFDDLSAAAGSSSSASDAAPPTQRLGASRGAAAAAAAGGSSLSHRLAAPAVQLSDIGDEL